MALKVGTSKATKPTTTTMLMMALFAIVVFLATLFVTTEHANLLLMRTAAAQENSRHHGSSSMHQPKNDSQRQHHQQQRSIFDSYYIYDLPQPDDEDEETRSVHHNNHHHHHQYSWPATYLYTAHDGWTETVPAGTLVTRFVSAGTAQVVLSNGSGRSTRYLSAGSLMDVYGPATLQWYARDDDPVVLRSAPSGDHQRLVAAAAGAAVTLLCGAVLVRGLSILP